MREVIVIGAGVTGISVARALARDGGADVVVLERDAGEPRGSTMHAPGLVGVHDDARVLTDLARASAAVYERAGVGFLRSGGLELATSVAGVAELHRRVDAAHTAGLRAELLSTSDLPATVTGFVDPEPVAGAAFFADDGSADVRPLMRWLRADAASLGVRLRQGQEVIGIEPAGPRVVVRVASGDRIAADAVVIAVGVWGPGLARLTGIELPLFPVAHPYVYDVPRPTWSPGPFVRWPERHVYGRVHGDRLGIGSYDHSAVGIEQHELDAGAGLAWRAAYDRVLERAQTLLLPTARFSPARRVNGVFALTPDNHPLVGAHPTMPGVWIAQAVWVTHAAGVAARLADAMLTGSALPPELDVTRFDGAETAALRARALHRYRDIYANDASGQASPPPPGR